MRGASRGAGSEIKHFLPLVLLQDIVETNIGQYYRQSIDFSFLRLVRGVLRGGSGGDIRVVFRAVGNDVCGCWLWLLVVVVVLLLFELFEML